jgi:uncharacterized protein YlaI
MKKKGIHKEICNECGKSVRLKSGLFVNRIKDLSDFEDRVEQNKPFPIGEYICEPCNEKINKLLC